MTRSEMKDLVPGYVRLEDEEIKKLAGNNDGKLNVAQCNLLNITVLSSESWLQLNHNQWIKESLFKKLMAVRTKYQAPVSVNSCKKKSNPVVNHSFVATTLDFYSLQKI